MGRGAADDSACSLPPEVSGKIRGISMTDMGAERTREPTSPWRQQLLLAFPNLGKWPKQFGKARSGSCSCLHQFPHQCRSEQR
jgi:hypothetical protein